VVEQWLLVVVDRREAGQVRARAGNLTDRITYRGGLVGSFLVLQRVLDLDEHHALAGVLNRSRLPVRQDGGPAPGRRLDRDGIHPTSVRLGYQRERAFTSLVEVVAEDV